jgi:small subunit ribosomal protein S16
MVKIRLRRVGAKKRPSYRLVVADSRAPRDGAFISIIGHYNPLADPEIIVIDEEKARQWLGRGAQPTDTVARLLVKAGIIEEPEAKKAKIKAEIGGKPKAIKKKTKTGVKEKPEINKEEPEESIKEEHEASEEKPETNKEEPEASITQELEASEVKPKTIKEKT